MNEKEEDKEENYLLRKQDVRKFLLDLYEWINKPQVSRLMLITLIIIIIVNIIINSILFAELALWSLIISIILYLPVILIKAKQKSGLLALVGKVLDVLIKDDEDDEEKVAEMENAVMVTMYEINKYYEKKLKKFTIYLKKKKEGKNNE